MIVSMRHINSGYEDNGPVYNFHHYGHVHVHVHHLFFPKSKKGEPHVKTERTTISSLNL